MPPAPQVKRDFRNIYTFTLTEMKIESTVPVINQHTTVKDTTAKYSETIFKVGQITKDK